MSELWQVTNDLSQKAAVCCKRYKDMKKSGDKDQILNWDKQVKSFSVNDTAQISSKPVPPNVLHLLLLGGFIPHTTVA